VLAGSCPLWSVSWNHFETYYAFTGSPLDCIPFDFVFAGIDGWWHGGWDLTMSHLRDEIGGNFE
jgi:hypothetical protein